MKKLKKLMVCLLAMLITVTSVAFIGCGNRGSSNSISYIMITGGGALDGAPRIKKEVNKIVQEKLGFEVDITYLSQGEYAQKMNLKFGTNEYFDMCYMGSLVQGCSYALQASKGYFADITEALPEYAPDIYNALSADVWNAAKLDGKIYGVINEQSFARSVGVAIDKEVLAGLKAQGYELTQERIDNEGLTYIEVINKAMEYIKADPEMAPNGNIPTTTLVIGHAYDDIFMQNYGFDSLGTETTYPGVIKAVGNDTEQKTVINQYETPEFLEFAEFCMDMHAKGYIPEDQRRVDITENQRVRLVGCYQPGCEADLYITIGREFEQFRFGTPLLTTSNVTSSVSAISVNSKNVDKCLKFLNLLYTNKELYNLLAIGQEGAEYKWETGVLNGEEYQYISYIKGSNYLLNTDWSMPTMFNAYRKIKQPEDMVSQIKGINSTATVSRGNGFTFIPSRSVASYQDDCAREIDTVITQLINGTYDKTKTARQIVDALNSKLDDNGLNDILTEKQQKYNAFLGA